MADETKMILDTDKIIINDVKKCLSNTGFKNISNDIRDNEIKNYMMKLKSESNSNIRPKNNFELIIDSIAILLDDDKFKFEKSQTQHCKVCNNHFLNTFSKRYVKITLDNYEGQVYNIDEFFEKLESEWRCKNCKQPATTVFNYISLPEILIIILGYKGEDRAIKYNYKEKFKYLNKNNKYNSASYILRSLICETGKTQIKPFLFRNETDFNKNLQKNEGIFSYPTILFYEVDKKNNINNEEEDVEMEYLNENQMPEKNQKGKKIMVYFKFKFRKDGKEIYLEIDNTEKWGQALIELKDKYNWLKSMKNLKFKFGNRTLNDLKSLEENGLDDGSEIDII